MSAKVVAAARPERDSFAQSERAMAELWRRAHTLSDGLVSQDGRRFRVVYPGRASSRAGPDFLDAVLETRDGDKVTGDIELHLNAPDWYAHSHHTDPNYNGVVMHVVMRPKGGTTSRQQSGRAVPMVSIADAAPELQRAEDSGGEVLDRLNSSYGTLGLGEILDRAGDERFVAKSRGFALELAAGDTGPDQLLYTAVMDALGYASNRGAFRELSRRVPIASLARLKNEPHTTRLLAIEAMLIATSGLLRRATPADEGRQMRALLRRLPGTRHMSPRRWHVFRVRPANHPIRRIIGAAHLVDRHIETGLISGLADEVRCGATSSLITGLKVPSHIGVSCAGSLAVNVILPFFHAYGSSTRSTSLSRACLDLYHTMPAVDENEITREMRRLLRWHYDSFQAASGRRQQGLIHLYKTIVARNPGRTGDETATRRRREQREVCSPSRRADGGPIPV